MNGHIDASQLIRRAFVSRRAACAMNHASGVGVEPAT